MDTTSHISQFCITDGPSLDALLEVLKRGTSRDMKPAPYFVGKEAEYVHNPARPHALPMLRPIKGADAIRFAVRNVQSVRRLEGNIIYAIECLIDESNEPVTFMFIVHGRIGQFALNPQDAGVQVFLQQN